MIVLAIDPSSTVLGWAVYDYDIDDSEVIAYGKIDITKMPYERRPAAVTGHMQRLQNEHQSNEVAIEQPFRTPKYRVDELGVAFKSIKKWAARNKLAAFFYAVPVWKLAVIGRGNATKAQVMATMNLLLDDALGMVNSTHLSEHEADALAIGEYHVRMRRFEMLAQKNLEEMQKRIGIK